MDESLNPPGASLQQAEPLEEAIRSTSTEVLKTLVLDPQFNEDLALALLNRSDLPADIFEQLSKSSVVRKSRKAKLAIVSHLKAPRYVSLALLRQLFTFDLMKVALTPTVAGDIKAAADEVLIQRLESLSPGERLSLARRASGRVVAALLLDPELRVLKAALQSPRLTEALVIRALMSAGCSAALVRAVCEHSKWSLCREIRIALLRNAKTPANFAQEFGQGVPGGLLKEILQNSRLPENVKSRLLNPE